MTSTSDGGGLAIVLGAVAAMALGLVMVFSTSAARPLMREGRLDPGHPLVHHLAYVLAGLVAILVLARIDYHSLGRLAPWLLGGALVLLAALQVPGVTRAINGARRWYRIGPLSVQPSEFAKVALILFLAWFLGRERDPLRRLWRGFVPAVGVVALAAVLVAVEPDFGTAAFVGALGGILILLGGARIIHLLPTAVVAGSLFVALMIQRFEHVRMRLESFRSPMAHYNTEHSLLALGSGGLAGLGLGNGREKLAYLPENSSDFIFSVIGEELGFVGAVVVVALFVFLLWQGVRVASRCRDTFGFYLASGVTFMIGLQALIHIAVSTASVPTKGIPLPFISMGGSNLLCLSLGVGLMASVARWGGSLGRGETWSPATRSPDAGWRRTAPGRGGRRPPGRDG